MFTSSKRRLTPRVREVLCCWMLLATLGSLQVSAKDVFLAQGSMSGEVSHESVLLQTRLTSSESLNAHGDIEGMQGVAAFQWSLDDSFDGARTGEFVEALPENDFIVRAKLSGLESDTRYFYRVVYGLDEQHTRMGPTCSFSTLPGPVSQQPVDFLVGSCMNYIKFLHGREGNASGPLTATEEDKRLGFPAFETMARMQPDFFIGTGDIVYYDNKFRPAETLQELRACWHEQFRFPRLIQFFQHVPTFWSKDDHDFRFNDSDNASGRLPLPQTGIALFKEQLPIAPQGEEDARTYRTVRLNRFTQIWLTEGRDYRSPNAAEDGPEKSLWGAEQKAWLKRTLKASDARWKILVSPTPMVGPDSGKKRDNHANLNGFQYEAGEFFEWLQKEALDDLILICGDRHWQYHSIHPLGVHEFACGALNDENAVRGFRPGDLRGSDPDGVIKQPFIYSELSGGFIQVIAGQGLDIRFYNDLGQEQYHYARQTDDG